MLAAETLANGQTYQAAASAASCNVSTIKRWMTQDPEFVALVNGMVDDRIARNARMGHAAFTEALTTATKLLKSKDEAIQVRAVRPLIAAGMRLAERTTRGDDKAGDLDRYLRGIFREDR